MYDLFFKSHGLLRGKRCIALSWFPIRRLGLARVGAEQQKGREMAGFFGLG